MRKAIIFAGLIYATLMFNEIALASHEGFIQHVYDAFKNSKWSNLFNHATNKGDPVLQKLAFCEMIFNSKTLNNKNQVIDFIDKNPDWPVNHHIVAKLEESISAKDLDDKSMYKWFEKHEPKTNNGKKYYASMLLLNRSTIRSKDFVAQIVLDVFIKSDLRTLPIDYCGAAAKNVSITPQHYIQKARYAIATKDYTYALETLDSLLKLSREDIGIKKEVRILKKRIESSKAFLAEIQKLQKHKAKNASIYRKYSYEDIMPAIEIRKNKILLDDEKFINALIKYECDEFNADSVWNIREYVCRHLIETHQYRKAYATISKHKNGSRSITHDAEFLKGWILLNFLNKPKLAIEHFSTSLSLCQRPKSASKLLYWIGRSYAEIKQSEIATRYFRRGAEYSYCFYGQMCEYELGNKKITMPKEEPIDEKMLREVESSEYVKLIKLLASYKSNRTEFYVQAFCERHANEKNKILGAVKAIAKLGDPHATSTSAIVASAYSVYTKELFDIPYKLETDIRVEHPIVYAVIKQESSFGVNRVAYDGGMGIMQIMPKTGQDVARSLKIQYDPKRLINDKEYNIKIGSKHLLDHINTFDGSYIMAVGAYNGGASNVKRWTKKFGDPRTMSIHQVINWIECVPVRFYIQSVIANLCVFRNNFKNNDILYTPIDIKRVNKN